MKKRIISLLILCVLMVNILLTASFSENKYSGLIQTYKGNTFEASTLLESDIYPEYYSSVDLGYVNEVNDQQSTGLCWAFTHNEVLEAYIAMHSGKVVNLSEQTMKFETSDETNEQYGYHRAPNDGGNELISTSYLSRYGVTYEKDEPFSISEKRKVNPKLLERHGVLKSVPMVSFTNKQKDIAINHIKKLVTDYAAVGSSLYFDTRYEDSNCENYYYYGSAGNANHAITIVGWDDNYSRENFKKEPEGDGAFIVKNSWGNTHANNTSDLVYVSYYDAFITKDIFASSFEMENEVYDVAYQYDTYGLASDSYIRDDDEDVILYATKYKKTSPGQLLTAASTYVTDSNATVEVLVNKKDGDVSDKKKFEVVYENTFEYPGYYLMEFPEIELTGEEFVVAIRVTNFQGVARFPLSQNLGTIAKKSVQKSNTCFISGGEFKNMQAVETVNALKMSKAMLAMGAFSIYSDYEMLDAAEIFTDVKKGSWYEDFVSFAVTNYIFDGTSDTTFAPMQSMTRAQFVQVLANISGVDTSDNTQKTKFRDVPEGKWYTAAVQWAVSNNIVSGMNDYYFMPDTPVTREQMCVMIVNYTERYLGIELEQSTNVFKDDEDISDWAKTEVYKCVWAELISGVGNNCFEPASTANRAMGATIFTKFYKNFIFK